MRRVAQAAEESAEARALLGAALPAGFPFLEAHDVGDAAIEERAGFGPAFALIVEPGYERRSVDRAQGQALGVMVEVGRLVAGQPPHEVGAVPARLEPG